MLPFLIGTQSSWWLIPHKKKTMTYKLFPLLKSILEKALVFVSHLDYPFSKGFIFRYTVEHQNMKQMFRTKNEYYMNSG